MAEDEVDFSKLSIEERCAHKNFKARLSAYEELIKIFQKISDEKSPEWSKYMHLVKSFPVDPHAAAQEKGLEAALIFLENCSQGPRLVGDIMSGVVAKCLTATRARVKELGVTMVMMCVEVEKYEIVQDELTKGMDHKNPKIVAACISVLTQAIREFGAKIFKAKNLAKKLVVLLEDRDKNVREESKKMVLELWQWIGPPFRNDLSTLKPVVLTELDAEYAKVSGTKPQTTRFLRSQQEKKKREQTEDGTEEEAIEAVEDAAPEVDPYDLLQPEDILSKLPKDFYEKVEAKKWQERKEALDALEALTSKYQKLEPGDYADLVRALKRVVSKDANVVVVAVGVKCVGGLASGLKKKFSSYAPSIIQSLFDKFKEKKPAVLNAVREASDACYSCTTLESIAEDSVAALQNKNPNIKTEVALFLSRAFSKTPNKTFTDKKFMKPFVLALLANLNESDLVVRDAAAECLGVCYKAMGEKAMLPFVSELEPLKLAKIKDFAEKAVILAPKPEPKPKAKPKPAEAPKADVPTKPSSAPPAKKGPTIKKPGAPSAKKVTKPVPDSNSNYDLEASSSQSIASAPEPINPNVRVDISTKLGDGLLEKMADKNWKTREEALDKLSQVVLTYPKIQPYLGDLVGAICLRLQDSNRTLASTAFVILQNLAGSLGPHCKQHLRQFLPCIMKELSDNRVNVRSNVLACLSSWAQNTSVEEFFQGEMIADALKLPSPLLRTELYNWLSPRLAGMKAVNKDDMATALPMLYSCIEDRNVDVRKSAMDCVLGFMIHLGYERMSLQAGRLKPSSKTCVMAALEKARPLLPAKAASAPGKGKTSGGTVSKGKPKTNTGGVPSKPGTARETAPQTPSEANSSTKSASSPQKPPSESPSSAFGSAETLVISPPPLIPMESESIDIVSAEIEMPISSGRLPRYARQGDSHSDDWNGVPKEFQIDFPAIERRHGRARDPMPPLVLMDTNLDFLDEPVRKPRVRTQGQQLPSNLPDEGVPPRAGHSMDLVIVQVASADLRKGMEALVQVEQVVKDAKISKLMISRIDQLLLCLIMQMRKMLPTMETAEKERSVEMEQMFRCIASCLQTIYRVPELARKPSMDTIKDLIYICLLVLVDPTMNRLKGTEGVIRYFNILVVRVIERSDLNNAICACMRLLTDALNFPHFNRIMDLTMKCQWKALKQLTLYVEERQVYDYDISAIINEFHIFLSAHPFDSWKDRDTTPLKTMKTVVHNIVAQLGHAKVYKVLIQKPQGFLESETGQYMKKLVQREMAKPSLAQPNSKPNYTP